MKILKNQESERQLGENLDHDVSDYVDLFKMLAANLKLLILTISG
jgi:hypothetical protein